MTGMPGDILSDVLDRKLRPEPGPVSIEIPDLKPIPEVDPLDVTDPLNRRMADILGGEEQLQLAHRYDTAENNFGAVVGGEARELVDKYRRNRAQAIYELGLEQSAGNEIQSTMPHRGLPLWPDFSQRNDPLAKEFEGLDKVTSAANQFLGAFTDTFVKLGYGLFSFAGDPATLNSALGLDAQLGSEPPDSAVMIRALGDKLPLIGDKEGVPFAQVYRQAREKERGIEESAETLESIGRSGLAMGGELTALFVSPLGKAITAPGMFLGKTVTKAPKWMQKAAEVGGTAVGWGTVQGLSQYYDPETGELNGAGKRIAIGAEAAAWWPVYEAIGKSAAVMARASRVVGKDATKAFREWAEKTGAAERPGSPEAWGSQAWAEWIGAGMPGLPERPAREIAEQAIKLLGETAGFSLLDAEMRSDLVAGFISNDPEARERAMEKFLSTGMGLLAVKGMGVENIPDRKREAAPKFAEGGDGPAPGGEGPKPKEPKPDPAGPKPEAEKPGEAKPEAEAKAAPAKEAADAPTARPETLASMEQLGWSGSKDGTFRLRGDNQRTFRIADTGEVSVSESLSAVIRDSELPPLEAIQHATLRNHIEAARLFAGLGGREVDTDGSLVFPSGDPTKPSQHIARRFGSTYVGDFFKEGTWRNTEIPAIDAQASPQQLRLLDAFSGFVARLELPREETKNTIAVLEAFRDIPREVDGQVEQALQFVESGAFTQVAAADPALAVNTLASIVAGYQTAQRAVENLAQSRVAQAKQAKPKAPAKPKKLTKPKTARQIVERVRELDKAGPPGKEGSSARATWEAKRLDSIKRAVSTLHKELGDAAPMWVKSSPSRSAGPLRAAAKEMGVKNLERDWGDIVLDMLDRATSDPTRGLDTFAADVLKAAAKTPSIGKFGRDLAFISELYDAYSDSKSLAGWKKAGGMPSLAAFKEQVIAAARAKKLALKRADLVEAMDPMTVRNSEVRDLNAQFHFVVARERENPAAGGEAGAVTPKEAALGAGVVGGAYALHAMDMLGPTTPFALLPAVYGPWAKSMIAKARDTDIPAAVTLADIAQRQVDNNKSYRGALARLVSKALWETSGLSWDPRVSTDKTGVAVIGAAMIAGHLIRGPVGSIIGGTAASAGRAMASPAERAKARANQAATRKLEERAWEKPFKVKIGRSGATGVAIRVEDRDLTVRPEGPEQEVEIDGRTATVEIGVTNFHRVFDKWDSGKDGPRSPEDQKIVRDLMADPDVARIVGDIAAYNEARTRMLMATGAQLMTKKGELVPLTYDADGRRMMRMPTEELRWILANPGHFLHSAYVAARAEWGGISIAEAQTIVEGMAERLVKHIGAEHERTDRYTFDAMKVDGEPIELFEARPHQFVLMDAQRSARRAATIQEFGQYTLDAFGNGKPWDARGARTLELLQAVQNAGGNEVQKVQDMMKLLSGIPLDAKVGIINRFTSGGGAPGRLARNTLYGLQAGLGLAKSAALSAAYLINLPETFANLAIVTGHKHVLQAWGSLVGAVKEGKQAQLWDDLRDLGIITEEVPYTQLNNLLDSKGWGRAWAEGRFLKEVQSRGRLMSGLTKAANEINDILAGSAAISYAGEMQRDGGKPQDWPMLRMLGFSEAEADRIMQPGGMTNDEVMRYARQVVSATQGGTALPVEKGYLQNMDWWRALIPFDTWAASNARMFAEISKFAAEAGRAGKMSPVDQAKLVGDILAKKTVTAEASRLLKMAVMFGVANAFAKWLADWKSDPLGEVNDIWWMAFGGGPGDAFRFAARGADEVTDYFSMFYVVRWGNEFARAANNDGPYRDLDMSGTIAEFVRRNVPAWKYTETLVGDPALSAATSAAYNWMRANGVEFGGNWPAQNTEFSIAMKAAMNALEAGDPDGFVERVQEAAGAKSVADAKRSIKSRTMLSRIKKELSDAQVKKLAEDIGADLWGAIQRQHDAAIALSQQLHQ